ncbi:AfsR/SARP family transcriptional regulator [Streptomyces abyssomicinicus]|uniref:AfsR/SARP family transcriptional regulator n=1 Tax=Streptomyces abyssomicinicus TaxID=574929 RepID=UPI001250B241|nr:AfsR/SARP family transcriptional regulator [Streptomyces abyssomicinicus]
MKIRLLGAVEIHGRDGAVRLPSEKARALLALLAWRPNAFLSDERAAEEIWGGDQPVHPTGALYTCATRLRRAIAEPGQSPRYSVVARRRGGYQLLVDPQDIDLHRFRGLLAEARHAVRRDDDAEALEMFDAACALWSGLPLPDLSIEWAGRARAALEREWLGARTSRIAVLLRMGRQGEAIPELFQLAEQDPLDERIAAMLMLSLHRDGRQHEALRCYSRIRAALVEELGDEPGADLRFLHTKVIARAPELARPGGIRVAGEPEDQLLLRFLAMA